LPVIGRIPYSLSNVNPVDSVPPGLKTPVRKYGRLKHRFGAALERVCPRGIEAVTGGAEVA
jgi:hypothetical protein